MRGLEKPRLLKEEIIQHQTLVMRQRAEHRNPVSRVNAIRLYLEDPMIGKNISPMKKYSQPI
jgi:hypothetical protein